MNHYLTSTATEYYPDTDRMLLMLGFRRVFFKKILLLPSAVAVLFRSQGSIQMI
jgi:hypothetical protein